MKQQKATINNDRTSHARYLVIYGIIGYSLCTIADYILEYLPNNQLTWESFNDYNVLLEATKGTTTKRFGISGVLGIISMIFISLGLVGISEYIHKYSSIASEIMLVGGIGAATTGAGYHIITTLLPWIFLSGHSTKESFEIVNQFLNDHQLVLKVNSLCYIVFSLTYTFIVITGKTPLPRWASVIHIGFLFSILDYFKVPGAANTGGLIMCICFYILSGVCSSKNTKINNNKKKE